MGIGAYEFTLLVAEGETTEVVQGFNNIVAGTPEGFFDYGNVIVSAAGDNDSVNPSNTGLGGDANSLTDGEGLRFDFQTDMSDADKLVFGIFAPQDVEIQYQFYNGSETVGAAATLENVNEDDGIIVPAADGAWDSVVLTVIDNGSSLKITSVDMVMLFTPPNEDLVFTVAATDGDGDAINGTINVAITAVEGEDRGIVGGHIDVDTYLWGLGTNSDVGDSTKHEHEYDDKANTRIVDILDYTYVKDNGDLAGQDFTELDDAVDNATFKLVLLNGHLNSGANIVLNYEDAQGVAQIMEIDAESFGADGQGLLDMLFTFDAGTAAADPNVHLLINAEIQVDSNALVNEDGALANGLRASETGVVTKLDDGDVQLSPGGEWRDGALSLMAVEDDFDTGDVTYNSQGQVITDVDTDKVYWETTIFEHNNEQNQAQNVDYYGVDAKTKDYDGPTIDVVYDGIATSGDDSLAGLASTNDFVWELANVVADNTDTITNFDLDNDVINISDLLDNTSDATLTLSFVDGDAQLVITDAGDQQGVDQTITLQGVSEAELEAALGLSSGTDASAILTEMLSQNKIID